MVVEPRASVQSGLFSFITPFNYIERLTNDPNDCGWILDSAAPYRARVAALVFSEVKDLTQCCALLAIGILGPHAGLDFEVDKFTNDLRHGCDGAFEV